MKSFLERTKNMPGRWGCLNPIDAWGRLDIDPDYGKEPKAPKVYCPRNPDIPLFEVT